MKVRYKDQKCQTNGRLSAVADRWITGMTAADRLSDKPRYKTSIGCGWFSPTGTRLDSAVIVLPWGTTEQSGAPGS